MEYVLEKGEIVSFVASAGNQDLHVTCGCIWLTRAEDAQDYILTPSSRLFVKHAESIVLEALDNAAFSIIAVDAQAEACLTIHLNAAFPNKV